MPTVTTDARKASGEKKKNEEEEEEEPKYIDVRKLKLQWHFLP